MAMSQAYLTRYSCQFEPLMMCDDIKRFESSKPKHLVECGRSSVVYAGSLGSHRWKPLLDLCAAARELREEGIDIVITALVSGLPIEALRELRGVSNLNVLPAPNHEALPAYLKGSDLLFLPESFEMRQAKSIQLSISSKAHLYMMSERPVLIYAPPISGIVGYARETEWGCVVDRQDRTILKIALKKLLLDEGYRHKLATKGREVALQRHASTVVRERIRQVLFAAGKKPRKRCL